MTENEQREVDIREFNAFFTDPEKVSYLGRIAGRYVGPDGARDVVQETYARIAHRILDNHTPIHRQGTDTVRRYSAVAVRRTALDMIRGENKYTASCGSGYDYDPADPHDTINNVHETDQWQSLVDALLAAGISNERVDILKYVVVYGLRAN